MGLLEPPRDHSAPAINRSRVHPSYCLASSWTGAPSDTSSCATKGMILTNELRRSGRAGRRENIPLVSTPSTDGPSSSERSREGAGFSPSSSRCASIASTSWLADSRGHAIRSRSKATEACRPRETCSTSTKPLGRSISRISATTGLQGNRAARRPTISRSRSVSRWSNFSPPRFKYVLLNNGHSLDCRHFFQRKGMCSSASPSRSSVLDHSL
jgi:hypothetical protein